MLPELGKVKFRDTEDMVHRMKLTYDEFADILDVNILLNQLLDKLYNQAIRKLVILT